MLTPEEKELVLKVANLIEQGSFGMQQITGHYFYEGDNGRGCCALGACLIALKIPYPTASDYNLLTALNIETWPRIEWPKGFDSKPFAIDDNGNAPLPDAIICLNDSVQWSFSQIIDHLRDCTLDKPATIAIKG